MPYRKTGSGKATSNIRKELGLAKKGRLPGVKTLETRYSTDQIKQAVKKSGVSGISKQFGAHSFPGTLKHGKFREEGGIKKGTPGLFTQSIKGMEGKKFIEKALDRTIRLYLNEMEKW